MKQNILIVEDEFIVANDLRIILEKAGYHICGIAPSYTKALELLEKKQPDWVLVDIFLKGDKTGIELAAILADLHIPFIYISANTNQSILEAAKATQPYGFLVKPFREKDLLVMLDIAQYHHEQNFRLNKQQAALLDKQMLQIICSNQARDEKLQQLGPLLETTLPFHLLSFRHADSKNYRQDLILTKSSTGVYRAWTGTEILDEMSVSLREAKNWETEDTLGRGAAYVNGYDFKKQRLDQGWLQSISHFFQLESMLSITIDTLPFPYRVSFLHQQTDLYNSQHTALLNGLVPVLTAVIHDVLQSKAVEEQTIAIKKPSVTPPAPAVKNNFHGIIGRSPVLLALFDRIELVAPADISVLVLGESGTGKERIAQTIHRLSPRKSKAFVVVNCAALPVNLIESELFGHEKGAFTGASDKRIGKFEQADGGTIFLDEIGELNIDAQVKLLRVLQEKEIERIGGSHTKKVNVRVIAATNRNLEKEVAEGRFRLDLYYRLNVLPLTLPPLRERKGDIALLAGHFLEQYSKKSGRSFTGFTAAVLEELMAYDWPGNIRELEHLIEKSVLLNTGTTISAIEISPAFSIPVQPNLQESPVQTMEEMERSHIMNVLALCKGKVFGAGGAAEMLNIPSTTLNSKIKKLGIKLEFVKD